MLSDLITLLDDRAAAAHFVSPDNGVLTLTNDPNWPGPPLSNQVKYWSTQFAAVLLVNITATTFRQAWEETRQAEAFLDAGLLRLEKKGSVVDGYLVLALDQINEDLRLFISDVEKNTRFVRKHVVYLEGADWQRVQRITPLGLSEQSEQTEYSEFTPETPEMSKLLTELATSKGKELARQHGKQWDLNE